VHDGRLQLSLCPRGGLKRRIDASLDAYARAEPTAALQLEAEARRYLATVTKELALLDAAQVAASARVDRREVDPTFGQLQRRLDQIGAMELRNADHAATATDLVVTASLLLGGLGLIVTLWRLDALRSAAARRREHDLEFPGQL
jgi:hypothetical protein